MRRRWLGEPAEGSGFPSPWVEDGLLAALVAGVFLVGLYPQPLFDVVEQGTAMIFTGS